jgi:hypothetical protein
MGTVNNNFHVMQSWNKPTGEDMWDNGRSRTRYDEYEWRDYYRDNIDRDGRSRYQLWLNDRYTGQSFDPKSMETDKQNMINKALEAEKRVAERAAKKANAW